MKRIVDKIPQYFYDNRYSDTVSCFDITVELRSDEQIGGHRRGGKEGRKDVPLLLLARSF